MFTTSTTSTVSTLYGIKKGKNYRERYERRLYCITRAGTEQEETNTYKNINLSNSWKARRSLSPQKLGDLYKVLFGGR